MVKKVVKFSLKAEVQITTAFDIGIGDLIAYRDRVNNKYKVQINAPARLVCLNSLISW